MACTLYGLSTSRSCFSRTSRVGETSLKQLLKDGFEFEHDFLPVVAAAVCLRVRLWYQVSQLSVKVMNEKTKKNLCSIVFYEVVEFHVSVVF
ncbi:unnamed protein product, partial [Brassica rapa subsp. trilocularis]